MANVPPDQLQLGRSCVGARLITPQQLDALLSELSRSAAPDLSAELVRRGWVRADVLRELTDGPPPSATIPTGDSGASKTGPTGTIAMPMESTASQTGPTGTIAYPPTAIGPAPTGPTGTIAFPPSPSQAPTVPAQTGGPAGSDLPAEAEEAGRSERNRFGKYILVRVLGSGGMAVVHKAWDTLLHQWVALKFIKTDEIALSEAEDRKDLVNAFLAEARLAVKLNHPNIARVYELGQIGERYYMSQFYIDGPSLHEVIHGTKGRSQESRFYSNPQRYVSLLRDIAAAMAYAHGLLPPLIHRDLKPANVMLDSSGRAYIVDFGLAKELKAGQTSVSGFVKGTPKYMAPEQAEGRSHEMDGRTDIWAIGVILYEMLTGRAPFEHENLHRLLSMIVSDEATWPRHVVGSRVAQVAPGTAGNVDVPRDLEIIAMKCLQKDRRHRYQTAGELVADLDRYLKGEQVALPQHSAYWFLDRMGRKARKHRWSILPAVAAALALAATVLLWGRGSSEAPGSIPAARWEEASRVRDRFLKNPSEETLAPLLGLLGSAEAPLVPTARQGLGSWWIDFVQTREAAARSLHGGTGSRPEWLDESTRSRARLLLADLTFARSVNARREALGVSEHDVTEAEALLKQLLAWKGTFTLAVDVHPWATFRLRIGERAIARDASRQEDATPARIGGLPVGSVVLELSRGGASGSVTVPEERLRHGSVLRVWGTLQDLHVAID